MKYLSLFSGIGGFEYAIHQVFPDAECVGFSEIDKYAIACYQKHFPAHINFGDIKQINVSSLPDFDLLVGGSPCQDLSIAKTNRKGLDGERSGLFWKYVEVLKTKKPKRFILENVNSMPKEAKQIITETVGVEPIMLDAAKVSSQRRRRLYRTNIPGITQPQDRGIFLGDILEKEAEAKFNISEQRTLAMTRSRNCKRLNIPGLNDKCGTLTASYYKTPNDGNYIQRTEVYLIDHYNQAIKADGKAKTLGTNPQYETSIAGQSITDLKTYIRRLTPTECERLQCFPDGWTEGISNSQRYKTLGNAVNVEVVKHIISFLKL